MIIAYLQAVHNMIYLRFTSKCVIRIDNAESQRFSGICREHKKFTKNKQTLFKVLFPSIKAPAAGQLRLTSPKTCVSRPTSCMAVRKFGNFEKLKKKKKLAARRTFKRIRAHTLKSDFAIRLLLLLLLVRYLCKFIHGTEHARRIILWYRILLLWLPRAQGRPHGGSPADCRDRRVLSSVQLYFRSSLPRKPPAPRVPAAAYTHIIHSLPVRPPRRSANYY